MKNTIHSFDADGYYSGSSELPPFASGHNPDEATNKPLPEFDPVKERVKWEAADWVVELIPLPEPEPEPEQRPPQYPRFFGNAKLDLFTQSEQLEVVTATMTDPMVKLMYDRLLGSSYMTYEDPETELGLAMLVEKGLLTDERKSAIVALMQPR